MRRLTSLGPEEMPNVAGIDRFNYDPYADHSKVASKDGKAKEASTEDAEATLAVQDLNPSVDPQREIGQLSFFLVKF